LAGEIAERVGSAEIETEAAMGMNRPFGDFPTVLIDDGPSRFRSREAGTRGGSGTRPAARFGFVIGHRHQMGTRADGTSCAQPNL
jgi:hypothetical protein